MIEIRRISLIMGIILMFGFFLAECNAYETSVLTVKQINLSIDLAPNYNISYLAVPSEGAGSFGQAILINDTNNKSARATLLLLSFSDKSILETDPAEFSNYFEDMLFGAFKLGGALEKERYYLTNRNQQNITIRVLDMPESKNTESRELIYMAFWSLDRLNYFFLYSSERSLTDTIVKSLEVKS